MKYGQVLIDLSDFDQKWSGFAARGVVVDIAANKSNSFSAPAPQSRLRAFCSCFVLLLRVHRFVGPALAYWLLHCWLYHFPGRYISRAFFRPWLYGYTLEVADALKDPVKDPIVGTKPDKPRTRHYPSKYQCNSFYAIQDRLTDIEKIATRFLVLTRPAEHFTQQKPGTLRPNKPSRKFLAAKKEGSLPETIGPMEYIQIFRRQ